MSNTSTHLPQKGLSTSTSTNVRKCWVGFKKPIRHTDVFRHIQWSFPLVFQPVAPHATPEIALEALQSFNTGLLNCESGWGATLKGRDFKRIEIRIPFNAEMVFLNCIVVTVSKTVGLNLFWMLLQQQALFLHEIANKPFSSVLAIVGLDMAD